MLLVRFCALNYSNDTSWCYDENICLGFLAYFVVEPSGTVTASQHSSSTVCYIADRSERFYLDTNGFAIIFIVRFFDEFDFHSLFEEFTLMLKIRSYDSDEYLCHDYLLFALISLFTSILNHLMSHYCPRKGMTY